MYDNENNGFMNNEPLENDNHMSDNLPEFAVDENVNDDSDSKKENINAVNVNKENTSFIIVDNGTAPIFESEVKQEAYNEQNNVNNQAGTSYNTAVTPSFSYKTDNSSAYNASGPLVYEYAAEKGRIKKGKIIRFMKRAAAITVSAALFGLVAGGAFQFTNSRFNKNNESAVQAGTVNEIDMSYAEESKNETPEVVQTNGEVKIDSTDVSTVVENVMPAVVTINCTGEAFYDYFGRQYSQEINGSGSGIIVGQSASEILIVTNNHVVSDASVIEIVFDNNTTAKAVLKGSEAASDIAVVSVNVNDLSEDTLKNIKIASLGDSDELRMGEMAIAIGNALGYGQSVTVGYISGLNREITVDGITLNLIQTDAAINPGNSGGALLNIRGEVIGINSLKHAETDVEGIGYAIPISEVIPIINELMNREKLEENESGYLGITGKTVESDFASGFNMPVGVYVYSVQEGSPAEKAGLKVYDIITGIKGKAITSMTELQNVLSYTRACTEVDLKVMSLSDGVYVEKTLTVVLGSRPE